MVSITQPAPPESDHGAPLRNRFRRALDWLILPAAVGSIVNGALAGATLIEHSWKNGIVAAFVLAVACGKIYSEYHAKDAETDGK